MAASKPHKSDYIKNLIRSNPQSNNTDIAKMAKLEKPDWFESVEQARCMVRYYKGAIGETHRNSLTETDMITGEFKHNAKILLFDLETAPLKVYAWSKWQKGVSDDMIIQDWFILTWSAKWLFEDKVYTFKCTGLEALRGDDERITKDLWKMFEQADILIAHNLKKFDRKKANTRFLKHGLGLPSPYQQIDTLDHARKQFAITSNRLDYIASRFLNIEGKMETEKGLWWKAMEGDDKALTAMATYCDQDVRVLEDVYMWLRPYIQPHPNIGLFKEGAETSCTHCGGTDLKPIGSYYTYVNEYQAYRCGNCGGISRGRKTLTPIYGKKHLNVSTPR